jgi:glucan phosphoethanolaminetransferase (alkaline phosphatase superfamily)
LAIAVAGLLLLPNIFWIAFANGKAFAFSRSYALFVGLLPALLSLTAIFSLFGTRLAIVVAAAIPFLIVAPIEMFYIAHYGEPTWYAVIATALESNSRETADYFGAWAFVLAAASVVFVATAVVAIVCIHRSGLQWRGRWRWTTFVLSIACSVILVSGNPARHLASSNPSASQSAGISFWSDNLEPNFPVGVVLRLTHLHRERALMRREIEKLADFRFGARQLDAPRQRRVYVLVIGESSRADRWQLYGYDKLTNPRLLGMDNLVVFRDMVTPWSSSRNAVPIIVSRKKALDSADYFSESSISKVFSEAGYETYWMSNQIAFGPLESPISAVAYDAQHVSFFNIADYSNPGNFDEDLLPPLQAAIRGSGRDLFIVLHTLGSHENYAYRYPEAFDVFKPSLKRVKNPNIDDVRLSNEISNSYDDSVLYTDYVLSKVIETLKNTDAITAMLYASDHGEDLIDAGCSLTAHGSGTVYNFRIPTLFWYSNQYAEQYPQNVVNARQHSTSRLSTEDIFESLVDMAQIDFAGHDRSWSVFSPSFQQHPRIVTPLYGQVQLDFDDADESKNCHMMIPRTN